MTCAVRRILECFLVSTMPHMSPYPCFPRSDHQFRLLSRLRLWLALASAPRDRWGQPVIRRIVPFLLPFCCVLLQQLLVWLAPCALAVGIISSASAAGAYKKVSAKGGNFQSIRLCKRLPLMNRQRKNGGLMNCCNVKLPASRGVEDNRGTVQQMHPQNRIRSRPGVV
eukprot:1161592-Pelagomonas_calceolata.AAC.14